MKATIEITKTFDEGRSFSKDIGKGDLLTFFEEEGEYLERLAAIAKEHGKPGESFTITYEVKIEI